MTNVRTATEPEPDLTRLASLAQTFWEHSPDPLYFLDPKTRQFLYVNPAFEALFEYPLGEVLDGRVKAEDLVIPEEREKVMQRPQADVSAGQDRYEFTALTRTGRRLPVELSLRRLKVGDRTLVAGSVREVSARKLMEARLREEADLQRRRTLEAFQANVRIFQLTEKVRTAYEATQRILRCQTVEELSRTVVQVLCDATGMNYKSAHFYLRDGESLRRVAASDEAKPHRVQMGGSHAVARAFRGEGASESVGNRRVIPLVGHGDRLGALVLTLREEEQARAWQDNIVMTLVGAISLMLANLNLYQRLKEQTVVDPLTAVFNRRYFDERLATEFKRAARYKRQLSLVMADLDDFKQINDTFGHQQGDVLLRDVASLLGSGNRVHDVVCRYGGEEFALILPETTCENAIAKAERLRLVIAAHDFPNVTQSAQPFHLTISFGVACLTPQINTPEALVRAADQALYRSKQEGKNRTSI